MTDRRKTNGGKREGAGRKPGVIKKKILRNSVPDKYADQIKIKFKKIIKAYEERCKREL